MPSYQPPFSLTPEILTLVANIVWQVGMLTAHEKLAHSHQADYYQAIQQSTAAYGRKNTSPTSRPRAN